MAGTAVASLGLAGAGSHAAGAGVNPRHYVLVHGAWHGAWVWGPVVERLRLAGHSASTPTLAGLGERAHRLNPDIGLATHVQDVVAHLEMEDLRDVVLVGHSYAGMVIAGVLAAQPERIRAAVFLDAFMPAVGEALVDYVPPQARQQYRQLQQRRQPAPVPARETLGRRWGLNDAAMLDWVVRRLRPQPTLTFVEPNRGALMQSGIHYTYIQCTQNPSPHFLVTAEQARKDPRWRSLTIDTHHNAMLLAPDVLSNVLMVCPGAMDLPASRGVAGYADSGRVGRQ